MPDIRPGAGGAGSGGVNIAASNTTYTSGTVVISGGGNVTVGTNGQTITISAGGGVGGNFSAGVSTGGNTAGSTGITGTRMVLVGTNAVSLSQSTDANGNTVSIAAPVQTAQTGISGVANSETTYTSGTVSLGALGNITIRSTTGNQYQFSVPAQSVQAETQTFVGGLAGSNTTYTSGTVTITGVGGGVTVSSNTGQRIDISVAAPVAQTNQQGTVYAASNTTGTSSGTYDARTLSIAGDGIISVAASNSGFRISATQSVQTQNLHNVTLSGNTAGVMAQISSGTMTLAGGNNITVSQNGNAVTISGPNVGGAQTGISGIANSETTYTSGSVTLSALGAVTIRSTTGQHFQISVNSQTNQSAIKAFGVSNTGTTAGNTGVSTGVDWVIGGSGNVTASQSTAVGGPNTVWISVPAQSVQAETQTFIGGIRNSETTYTSGTVNLSVVGGNMTIRSTTGNALQFSVSQSVQAETQTFLGAIQNSETTYTSGTVNLSVVAGNLTIRSTTGQAFQFSASQTVQTQNMVAISGSNSLYSSGTLTITGSNMVTVKTSGAGQALIIDATQTNQSAIKGLGVSNTGNTAGNTGISSGIDWVIAGSNNITASQSTVGGGPNTIWISGGAGGAGMSAGQSNIGNSSGDTGVVTGRLVLAGGNNITLSGSTNAGSMTITVSAPNLGAGAMSAGASNLGNTAGSTGLTGTQLVMVGTGVVSLSQSTGANGGTLSISVPSTSSLSATGQVSISTNGSTISVGAPQYGTISNWPVGVEQTALSAYTATASLYATAATRTTMTSPVVPFVMPANFSGNHIRNIAQYSITTTASNSHWGWTAGQSIGIYTLNAGTALSLLSSFSNQQRLSYSSAANSTNASASWQMSWGSGTNLSSSTSTSTNNAAATSLWSSISNTKMYPFASGAFSMTPGQYWLVHAWTQSTSGANLASLSQLGMVADKTQTLLEAGRNVASTTGMWPLQGYASLTQTNTGMPDSIATANISLSSNAGSWVGRAPVVEMLSRFY